MILNCDRKRTNRSRPGLTLLEVLISLAIFFMSIIAITSLVDMAKEKAAEAEYRSVSLLVAESKMAELKAGVAGIESGNGTWETDDRYTWKIAVTSVGTTLSQVNVTAQRTGYPLSKVDLAQLVINPQNLGSTMDTVPDPSTTTDSSTSSGSATTGSGSTTSGSKTTTK